MLTQREEGGPGLLAAEALVLRALHVPAVTHPRRDHDCNDSSTTVVTARNCSASSDSSALKSVLGSESGTYLAAEALPSMFLQ